MAGQSLITIDNVSGELRGDALAQIIERPRPQVRILGKSELVDVEARGTTLFANGNNIIIVGDICRRVIRCRLDPKMERPELRVFTGNPVKTVLDDRGAYVAACLIVCRAYVAAGRPDKQKPLASFEGWSDTVRSALIWLGRSDPVDSMETVRSDDPESNSLRTLLSVWARTIGIGHAYRVSTREVIDMVNEVASVDTATRIPTYKHPELRGAVRAVMPSRRDLDAITLGYWLRNKKDRMVNDMQLKNETGMETKWWVAIGDEERGPEF